MGTPLQPSQPISSAPDRDIEENKDIAALGYVWVLSVFVFFYRRNSPFVRHHGRQGIVLFVLSLIFWAIPVVGRFLELPVLALMIMGFLNAAQGRYSPLPLIYALSHGDVRMLRQSWKVVVDAIVRLWRKLRLKHPSAGIKVSVQATPTDPVSPSQTPPTTSTQTPPVPPTSPTL